MARPRTKPAQAAANLLGLRVKSDFELHRTVEKGLPARSLEAVLRAAKKAGLEGALILDLVGPRSTMNRRLREHQALTTDESDRLVRFSRVYSLAVETFGSHDKAHHWLLRSSSNLSEGEEEVTPLQLLASETGGRLVEQRLHQIAHGMFA